MRYRVELTRTHRIGELGTTVTVALEEETELMGSNHKDILQERASALLEQEVQKANPVRPAAYSTLGEGGTAVPHD